MASQSKRPWLAALLATLVTGLGHFYLRRWKRGVGWFAAAIVVSALFVPPEAARALLSGSGGDVATVVPLLAVGVASVADAYVLARMRQRETADRADTSTGSAPEADADTPTGSAPEADAKAGDASVAAGGRAAAEGVSGSAAAECPECGKELDPDLAFCPWCTTRLGEHAGE